MSTKTVRLELPQTGPAGGLGEVGPGEKKEVFTSWVVEDGLEARFVDAQNGKTLETRRIDLLELGKDYDCAEVTITYPRLSAAER